MNNIGGANVVILKRPMIEEAEVNDKNYTYPVTAATQSQNKTLRPKNSILPHELPILQGEM